MHIHNVYFWLKSGLNADEKTEFEAGLKSLCSESNTRSGYFGKPAATAHRDVVDGSYSYSLVLLFDDLAAHDRYQNESTVHDKFIEENLPKWERVVVYDVEV